jgi:hypothetical protein
MGGIPDTRLRSITSSLRKLNNEKIPTTAWERHEKTVAACPTGCLAGLPAVLVGLPNGQPRRPLSQLQGPTQSSFFAGSSLFMDIAFLVNYVRKYKIALLSPICYTSTEFSLIQIIICNLPTCPRTVIPDVSPAMSVRQADVRQGLESNVHERLK